jgi:uncharacterized protein
MNPIQKSAFILDLTALKKMELTKDNLGGCLLAACSAHDPSPKIQVQVIKLLKSFGANVNEVDKNGVTPLHRAVRFRSPAAVKLLLEIGADVNAQDKKSGSTALHRAVTNTSAPKTSGKSFEIHEIVKHLIYAGANIKIKNKKGKFPADFIKAESLLKLVKGSK